MLAYKDVIENRWFVIFHKILVLPHDVHITNKRIAHSYVH